MGIIAWLILGAFSGWIASIIMGKNASMGAIANIVTGIIGAFIGGVVFNFFGAQKVTGLNIHSALVSIVGAFTLDIKCDKQKIKILIKIENRHMVPIFYLILFKNINWKNY